MWFDKNFATKEQMERINKLFHFVGNFIMCDKVIDYGNGYSFHQTFAITTDAPEEIIDEGKRLYQTADLMTILDELPHTVGVEFENGTFEHYYVDIDHYHNMISYSTSGDTDVLKVFNGDTLLDAAVDAIEWIYTKRNENDGVYIKMRKE